MAVRDWAEERGCTLCWDLSYTAGWLDGLIRSGAHHGRLHIGPIDAVRPLRQAVEATRQRTRICPACYESWTRQGPLTPADVACPRCGGTPSAHEILDALARGSLSPNRHHPVGGQAVP